MFTDLNSAGRKKKPPLRPLWKKSFNSTFFKSNSRKGCKYSRIRAHNTKTVENDLPKITQNIMIALRNLKIESLWSNRKLEFYSMFKSDQSTSLQLELIKNVYHIRHCWKLRSGYHNLRIETGRHSVMKIPENLRICKNCSSNEVENEVPFLHHCDSYSWKKGIRFFMT